MTIHADKLFRAALRFIDSGEDPDSREGVVFTQMLVELAGQLNHNSAQITRFIDRPITRATLSSEKLLHKFADAVRQLGREGVILPSPETIEQGAYYDLFAEDIDRIKQFATQTIDCTIQSSSKENKYPRPGFY